MRPRDSRGRIRASIAIAAITSAFIAGRAFYRAPLELVALVMVLVSAAWILGLVVLALGRPYGFYIAATSGLLLVNARMFSQLPGDDPYTWVAEVAFAMLGYVFSTFEAVIAWKSVKSRG
ncbi:MAG: hypothetical protein F7B17_05270 [Desulfurococcales archaeon]|nr:hypothetical protein [Desulfurococcales archaeon]